MTGLERILGTLGGQRLDRRAVTPVLCLYGGGLTRTPLPRLCTDAVAYAQGQAAVREAFEPDVLFAPFTFAGIGEAFGSEVRYFDDQAPNLRRPATTPEGWTALDLPEPGGHPRLTFLRDAVARMAGEHAGQVPVAAPLPSPVDLPALVLGLEAWLETVLFQPELARRILEDTVPFFVRLANGLFEAGAAFVVVPSGFTSPRILTRELVAAFAVPALASAFSQLRGPVVLHHVGTPMVATLDLVAALPGVVGFALDESDDPLRARQVVGPGKVLFVGPEGPTMPALEPAEVGRRWGGLLRALEGDPWLVLGTSGADIPLATPPDRILALRRAAETTGWAVA